MECALRVRNPLKVNDNKQRNPQAVCLSFKELFENDLPLHLIFHLAIKESIKCEFFSSCLAFPVEPKIFIGT